MRYPAVFVLSIALLTACAPPPPVNQSRGILWQRYGHHSLDDVLLAWGAPASETKLTNGARLVTYRHATTYDAASPYENTAGCEASFLAPPPQFIVENIALNGAPAECALLVQKGPGYTRNMYVPPPPPPPPGFYPGAYYR